MQHCSPSFSSSCVLGVLLVAVSLFALVSTVSSEGQCSAPDSSSTSSSDSSLSSSSKDGQKCSSCSSCSQSALPPLPELSSTAPHYALLLTYDITSCKIKEQHTVMRFFQGARDYGNFLRTRFMSVDKDGDPRMMIFTTESERDAAVVDANKMSEEQIKALLLGTAPPPPTPVYQFHLANVSLSEIEDVLKYFHIPKGFPVRYYPDEAVQGDLLLKP